MSETKITAEQILEVLRVLTESKKAVPREEWLNSAFKLESLRWEEAKLLNVMRQGVAREKLQILSKQEKKNVSLADGEIEATDAFRFMKDQEAKLETIDEIVRIAKRNADNF